MAEIGFLGTGGWIATRKRDNTSFLIQHEKKLFLIDCPGSVVQKIKLMDCDPGEITSILVTHVHPDHIYGLPSLVHSMMYEEARVNLYGSDLSIDFCRRLLDLFQLREERIKWRVHFVPLESGQSFRLYTDVSCTCLNVPHHPSSLAYFFQFGKEKKSLLYSGDTPLSAQLFEKAREADWLIHECSAPKSYFERYPVLYKIHTNAFDLGNSSQDSGVKKLIPCHIFGDLGFDESEIEQELLENYRGSLVMPHDLMRVKL